MDVIHYSALFTLPVTFHFYLPLKKSTIDLYSGIDFEVPLYELSTETKSVLVPSNNYVSINDPYTKQVAAYHWRDMGKLATYGFLFGVGDEKPVTKRLGIYYGGEFRALNLGKTDIGPERPVFTETGDTKLMYDLSVAVRVGFRFHR